MTTYATPSNGIFRAFDTAGKPLAYGWLHTYINGTTTPQNTYIDTLGTFHSNPLQLDQYGETTLYLDASEIYTFVLEDINHIIQPHFPLNNVSGLSEASSISTFIQALSSQTQDTSGDWLIGVSSDILANAGQANNLTVHRVLNTAAVDVVAYYNVDNTGSLDAASGINKALTDLANVGGGTLYLPAGTYLLNDSIHLDNYNGIDTFSTPRANIKIKGAGKSTIIKPYGNHAYRVSAFDSFPAPWTSGVVANTYPQNIEISDLTIDMNKANVVDGGAAYGALYSTSYEAIHGWPNLATGPSNFAASSYQQGICLYNAVNVYIHNVDIKNSWYNGVEVYNSTGIKIEDCTFTNTGDTVTYIGKQSGINLDNMSSNVNISNNLFYAFGTASISANGLNITATTSAIKDVLISSNQINGSANSVNGIYAYDWLQNWTIIGNKINTVGLAGINISLLTYGGAIPSARFPLLFNIQNNEIKGYNVNNTTATCGIVYNGAGALISGNTVYQSTATTSDTIGILTTLVNTGGTLGNVVENNFLIGNFPSASANNGIISAGSYTFVAGNKIWPTNSTSHAGITINGDSVVIKDNDVEGTYLTTSSGKAIYYESGSGVSVKDDKVGPACYLTSTSTHSLSSGTIQILWNTWGTLLFDKALNFNTTTDKFVAAIPGTYRFKTAILLTSATGQSIVSYTLNSNSPIIVATTSATGIITLVADFYVVMAANDTLDINLGGNGATLLAGSTFYGTLQA